MLNFYFQIREIRLKRESHNLNTRSMEMEDDYEGDSSTTYSAYDETPHFIDEDDKEEVENIRVVCRFRYGLGGDINNNNVLFKYKQ